MSVGAFRDTASARGAVAVDVSTADQVLADGCRGLWIGGAGNVAVDLLNTATITLTGAQAGTVIPVQAVKVLTSGTTATDILALY